MSLTMGILFYSLAALLVLPGKGSAMLHGVTFSGLFSHIDATSMCADVPTLRRNLEVAGTIANKFRTYSVGTCPQSNKVIFEYARRTGKKVLLGLWISTNTDVNKNELASLGPVASRNSDVIDGVLVGNEAVSIQKVPLGTVLSAMRRTRRILAAVNVTVPVATAEIWPTLTQASGPIIANASDFLCLQIQPFWEGRPVRCKRKKNCTRAARYVVNRAAELEKIHNKKVVICETGWPTAGEKCCMGRPFALNGFQAVPSIKNAKLFVRDLQAAAAASGREYFYHTALDSDWKRLWAVCNECTGLATDVPIGCAISKQCEVDYHWGLFMSSGAPKRGILA